MSFVQVFELNVKTDNVEALTQACKAYAEAAEKIDGLEKMEFFSASDDAGVLWQQIQWRDEAAVTGGVKKFWGLPEMGLLGIFQKVPPVKVREFKKI